MKANKMQPNPQIPILEEQIKTLQHQLREMKIKDFISTGHPELDLYLMDETFLTVVVRDDPKIKSPNDSTAEICTKDLPHNSKGIMCMAQVGIREDLDYDIALEKRRGHDIADNKDDVLKTVHSTYKKVYVKNLPEDIQRLVYEVVYEYIPEELNR